MTSSKKLSEPLMNFMQSYSTPWKSFLEAEKLQIVQYCTSSRCYNSIIKKCKEEHRAIPSEPECVIKSEVCGFSAFSFR